MGTLDELNAFLGDARLACVSDKDVYMLRDIQMRLSTLMGKLSGSLDWSDPPLFEEIAQTERWIEKLEENRDPPGFVIPGDGSASSSRLHIARTVCRRAERRAGPCIEAGDAPQELVVWLNRLSDLLYLLAVK
jgi:cob(I)alamin adenosyltransferase